MELLEKNGATKMTKDCKRGKERTKRCEEIELNFINKI